ncbi:MAG: hypothetical protein AAF433_12910 [Bacteroidota bacterium]
MYRLFCVVVLYSTVGCLPSETDESIVRQSLLQRFVEQPDIKATLAEEGILGIAKTAYCVTNNCEPLLEEIGINYYLGTREDLFQRMITATVIHDFSTDPKNAYLHYSHFNSGLKVIDY